MDCHCHRRRDFVNAFKFNTFFCNDENYCNLALYVPQPERNFISSSFVLLLRLFLVLTVHLSRSPLINE